MAVLERSDADAGFLKAFRRSAVSSRRASCSSFLGRAPALRHGAAATRLRLERHQLLEHLRHSVSQVLGDSTSSSLGHVPIPVENLFTRTPVHKREHGQKVDVLVAVTAVAAIAIATEACRQLRLRIPPDYRTLIVLSRPERRSCAERAAQARSGCYPGAQGITWFGAAPWARTVASHATAASYRDRGAVHRMEERPGTHELQSRTLCTLHHRGAGVAQQIDVGLLLLQ